MAVIYVDARGCACPQPVIKTKKAIEREHEEVVVLVDNQMAVENIKRLAVKSNHHMSVTQIEDYYRLNIIEEGGIHE